MRNLSTIECFVGVVLRISEMKKTCANNSGHDEPSTHAQAVLGLHCSHYIGISVYRLKFMSKMQCQGCLARVFKISFLGFCLKSSQSIQTPKFP